MSSASPSLVTTLNAGARWPIAHKRHDIDWSEPDASMCLFPRWKCSTFKTTKEQIGASRQHKIETQALGLQGSCDLKDQVRHKAAFIKEHMLRPGRPPAILVGHSIGRLTLDFQAVGRE